jgi:hypothetical protein
MEKDQQIDQDYLRKQLKTIESDGSKPDSDHQSDGSKAEMDLNKEIYLKKQELDKLNEEYENLEISGLEKLEMLEKQKVVSEKINKLRDEIDLSKDKLLKIAYNKKK